MKNTANTVLGIVIITMVTSMPLQMIGKTRVVEKTTVEAYSVDEVSLLDSIQAQAKNAYEGAVDMKDSAKDKLTSLMNDQHLSDKIKSSISEDIKIIQEGFDKHVASNVKSAYHRLQSTLDNRRSELSATPHGRVRRMINFVGDKLEDAKQGVSNLFHSIRS